MMAVSLAVLLQCVFVAGVSPSHGSESSYVVMLREHLSQEEIDTVAGSILNCRKTVFQKRAFLRATLTQAGLDKLSDDFGDKITQIDIDTSVRGAGTVLQSDAWWGQKRVVQDHPHLPKRFRYDPEWGASPDVAVYVVDSGVMCSHEELAGRCIQAYNTVDGETGDDFNGHGTHVASVITGTRFGVTKQTQIISVKVLNRESLGSISGVIDALGWIVRNTVTRGSVINLSLGTTFSVALNEAVAEAVAAGLHVVTAAGNYKNNACLYSPASSPAVITVAASGLSYIEGSAPFDFKHDDSNHGPCVTVYAPGVHIMGADVGGPAATAVRNGTSAASPHVAAIVAAKLTEDPTLSPAAMKAWLVREARPAAIEGNVGGTTDLMAHLPVEEGAAPEYPVVPESMENCFGYLEAEFSALQGTLTHPAAGGKYKENDMRCWAIRCAGTLELTFKSFSFEVGFDGLFTNNMRATGYTPPVYAPFDGDVLLRLESDRISTKYGFSVEWSCKAKPGILVRLTTGTQDGAASTGHFPVTLWFDDGSLLGTVTAPDGVVQLNFATQRAAKDLVGVVVDAAGETDGWFINSCEVLIDGGWVQWYLPSDSFAPSKWVDWEEHNQRTAAFTPLQAFELTVRIGTRTGHRYYDSASEFEVEAVYASEETEVLGKIVPPGVGADVDYTFPSRYPASAVLAVRVKGGTNDGWYMRDVRLLEGAGYTLLADPKLGTSVWMKANAVTEYRAARIPVHFFALLCDVVEPSDGVFDVHVTNANGVTTFAGHMFHPGKRSTRAVAVSISSSFPSAQAKLVTVSTQGPHMGGYDSVVLRNCVVDGNVLTKPGSTDTEITVSLDTPSASLDVPPRGGNSVTVVFNTVNRRHADSTGSFVVYVGYADGTSVAGGTVVAPRYGDNILVMEGLPKGAEDIVWVEVRHGGSDGWYVGYVSLEGTVLTTGDKKKLSWVDGDGNKYYQRVRWYREAVDLQYTRVVLTTGNRQNHESAGDFVVTLAYSDGAKVVKTVVPEVLGGTVELFVADKPKDLLTSVTIAGTTNDGWFISLAEVQLSELLYAGLKTTGGRRSTWVDLDSDLPDVEEVTFVAP